MLYLNGVFFFFQAEDGIRDLVRSRGLGDVYKRQVITRVAKDALVIGNFSAEDVLVVKIRVVFLSQFVNDPDHIGRREALTSVSYTHLTLPTIYSV